LVAGGYNAIAEPYLRYAAASDTHPRRDWLAELLDRLAPRSRVLELGCGPGVPTARDIAAAGHHLVGVDISARQPDLARQHVPGATFIEADMMSLELEPRSF